MLFADLKLSAPILEALHAEQYEKPTPIQAKAIPVILDGKDLLGCAQTGTGKTAAFSLPLLQRIMCDSPHAHEKKRHVRALVLSPTRELASQIGQSVRTYGSKTGVRYAVIFGGVGQGPQVDALRSGVDVLIATPGRLLDLMNQRQVDLTHVEFFVLDEADRMLDMGFVHDIRKVIQHLPPKRQNLMFSATMPPEIRKLANSFLKNPELIEIAPVGSTIDLVQQYVYRVRKENKGQLLAHLYENAPMSRVIVFSRTKHGADRIVRKMKPYGIHAEAIHGDKAQNARQRALNNFKTGKTAMLIATDIAARGIDVDNVSHVVNYDIPNEPETYVHRIGRTGRAGQSGIAFSFCDEGDERQWLRQIERLIRKTIEEKTDVPTFAPVQVHQPNNDGPNRAQRRKSLQRHDHHIDDPAVEVFDEHTEQREEFRPHPAGGHQRDDRRHGQHHRGERRDEGRQQSGRSRGGQSNRGGFRGGFGGGGFSGGNFSRGNQRGENPQRGPQPSSDRRREERNFNSRGNFRGPGGTSSNPQRKGDDRRDEHRRDDRPQRRDDHPQFRPHAKPAHPMAHSGVQQEKPHRPPGDTSKGHNPSPKKPHRKGHSTHRGPSNARSH